jgi:Tol biopolymer transport system component
VRILRKVFEITNKQSEPDVGPRIGQEHRQRAANLTKRPAAFVVAAAISLVAVACTPGTQGGTDAATPAGEPQTSARESPTEAQETISGPFLLDLRGGERTPLPENLAGGYIYAASPDGARLAFNTCCSAFDVMTVANIDGTDVRTFAPEGLNIYGPRWSPDGTKVVYQLRDGGDDDGLTADVGNLFVHDLSSGEKTQLTDLELSRAAWWYLSPTFSPDGRNVIFHLPRGRSETTKWDAWSVPVTGGEPTLVLRNAAFPLYLPDGKEIAFVVPTTSNFEGQSIARSADGQGSPRTLVEANSSIWLPTMSPDGSRIAYQDGASIYVVDVSTGESSRVADGDTADWVDDDTLIVTPA